jgi:hypothetical protein
MDNLTLVAKPHLFASETVCTEVKAGQTLA